MLQQEKSLAIKEIWAKRPLLISGPCSAETEAQVLATARELSALGAIHVFRAGIWKPRTRPGQFEGVGTKGLPWLQAVQRETGLPVAVEVANTKQVEDALHFGIDLLWIGARSSVNPASVQEIANALKGVDVPVLIKNPINPEIELWSGAFERIAKSNIKHIGLVHRGFSVYGDTDFRYSPMWHIAIEMRRRFPELPLICDPTHICGRRDIIQSVSQKAIDLDYDGLMIESHIDPDTAWTDKKQQLTPKQLGEILASIVWRRERSDIAEFNIALERLREQINQIDDELLLLLARRMKVADLIGECKKEQNITILQPVRWNDILTRSIEKGESLGLSKEFISEYLNAVHLESIRHQNSIMNETK